MSWSAVYAYVLNGQDAQKTKKKDEFIQSYSLLLNLSSSLFQYGSVQLRLCAYVLRMLSVCQSTMKWRLCLTDVALMFIKSVTHLYLAAVLINYISIKDLVLISAMLFVIMRLSLLIFTIVTCTTLLSSAGKIDFYDTQHGEFLEFIISALKYIFFNLL